MSTTTPMPKPKPSAGTPAQDANVSAETLAAAGNAPYGSGTKVGLDGRPVGSDITVGVSQGYVGSSLQSTVVTKKTQYTTTSAMETFAALGNQEKADLLAKLAQIPGIYATGASPTQEMIVKMAQSGVIVPRKQDVDALQR